ncbi:MAG TPA: signal peptidase I [Candidatus Paceibacterota bacterium]|nr:signal peptidase I [Candidatus Paceibacterota bacterium]
MHKKSAKKIIFVLAIILLVLINIANFVLWRLNSKKNNIQTSPSPTAISQEINNCQADVKEETYKIEKSSLSGIVESGDEVKVLLNYYQCNDIKRGDVVLYRADSKSEPIIKIVKGISGDKLGLQGDEKIWNILINDKILATSEGKHYEISKKDGEALITHLQESMGNIPPEEYLLLGNVVMESNEEIPFGLVKISDIIGKVVYK